MQVLGGDHIAVRLVGPLRDEASLIVGIQIEETDQIARCIVQRPPADVASLPVIAVKLDEEFVEAAPTGGRVARTPDILAAELLADAGR